MLSRTIYCRNLLLSSRGIGSNFRLHSQKTLSNTLVYKRSYAKSWDSKNKNEDISAHLKVKELMDKINSSEAVIQKLTKIQDVMSEKGLMPNEQSNNVKLSPMQMIKILMDKDLRNAMSELKVELDKAGIELSQDQLAPLMTVLGIKKKD